MTDLSLIINRVALARQVGNRIGSVCPSVRLCSPGWPVWPKFGQFTIAFWTLASTADNRANAVDWLLISTIQVRSSALYFVVDMVPRCEEFMCDKKKLTFHFSPLACQNFSPKSYGFRLIFYQTPIFCLIFRPTWVLKKILLIFFLHETSKKNSVQMYVLRIKVGAPRSVT